MKYRVGCGFDVHAFAEGRRLVLGGVEIPHTRGLLGHSDADALLHAIADAVLGAIGEGDIGTHFPNTDSKWKDCNSDVFVRESVRLAAEKGFRVGNVDATLMAERPKIMPHVPEMRGKIAEMMGVQKDCVAVKATTMERMGFVGREEGITAMAVVLLEKEDNQVV